MEIKGIFCKYTDQNLDPRVYIKAKQAACCNSGTLEVETGSSGKAG